MGVSRRSFLGGGAALFGSVAARGGGTLHTERPRLKLGVIADPHIGTKCMLGINAPATEKAFLDFRDQKVDAVAVLGDFTGAKARKMLIERKAVVFTVLTFKRQLFTTRRIVKTEVDVTATATTHHIADLGEMPISSDSAIFRQSLGFNAVGKSNSDKRKRNQSGL